MKKIQQHCYLEAFASIQHAYFYENPMKVPIFAPLEQRNLIKRTKDKTEATDKELFKFEIIDFILSINL